VTDHPAQKITYHDFRSQPLVKLLELEPPPLAHTRPFRQVEYIEEYLKRLDCQTSLLESHYIDRHYMEDHSIFYSRSFFPFENFCRRVHYFSSPPDDVKKMLEGLVQVGREAGRGAYTEACRAFSKNHYLGFSVIKPLVASRVGRTVLRHPQRQTDEKPNYYSDFSPTREYRLHSCGVALTVHGLAFQQQDVGVSACATTALWISLQKAKMLEQIRIATPAQITMLASQYTLPFGRPMPSEGLSIDQMCQATQALGIPPSLLKAENFETARSHLYSAINSGYAPIIILKDNNRYHAVTVVGMSMNTAVDPVLVANQSDDASRGMEQLFVHDDRIGPYVPALISDDNGSTSIQIFPTVAGSPEKPWSLTHILIPMHSKIRLSFVGLRDVAMGLLNAVHVFREEVIQAQGVEINNPDIRFEVNIVRSFEYTEKLFMSGETIQSETFLDFTRRLSLPRYVGIVTLSADYLGIIDVIVDTTSTRRNLQLLAVVNRGKQTEFSRPVAEYLATNVCACALF
jgi:hypothetical protein